MEDKRQNDEKIMILLLEMKESSARIDERTLNIVGHLERLNSKVATHELQIGTLNLAQAESKGARSAISGLGGATWGILSSVAVYAIAFFAGWKH